jgi:predicted dinucleotide-binding enzyme
MAQVGILGTGIVGRTLAAKLAGLGHSVTVGTRDPAALLARTEPDERGQEPFSSWLAAHDGVEVAPFADAAGRSDVVFNATSGASTLDALRAAGAANLGGKVLVDVANPLDFSKGMPPTLTVANTDSLAEQIQREFPEAKVVKALNIVTASVMVDPASVASGDHDMLIAGNDAGAKAETTQMLKDWFGWRSVIDVGDVTAARGLETYLLLWVRLMMGQGTVAFNIKIMK